MSLRKPKPKAKNQSLIPFLLPASKQSNSPLQKVREFVEEQKLFTNWNTIEHDGWKFPATDEPHCWCGMWKTLGCPKDKEHERLGYGYRVYVKQFQESCYRGVCTTCYPKWIARGANKATRRIEKYVKQNPGEKPIHLFFSPPKWMHNIPVDKLREEVKQILKKAMIKGGALLFHPFRRKKEKWIWSPHYHLVGFGSSRNIKNAFGWKKWYVGNEGERKSVFQTFCYLLSKCGIKKRNHALSWLGDLSYSKLPGDKIESLTHCPACGRKLIPIYYDGIHPVVPPDRNYEGMVDSDGRWYPVNTEPEPQISEYRFDYAPTRDLDETLKGLAMAN